MVCFFLCLPKTRTPFLNPLVLEKGVLGRALSKTRLVPYRSLGLTSNSSAQACPLHGFAFSDAYLQALSLFRPGAHSFQLPLGSASKTDLRLAPRG